MIFELCQFLNDVGYKNSVSKPADCQCFLVDTFLFNHSVSQRVAQRNAENLFMHMAWRFGRSEKYNGASGWPSCHSGESKPQASGEKSLA